MTLKMARCIGRPGGCDAVPSTRGLCKTCYTRHASRGTLHNYPTMRERTRQLRASGYVPRPPVSEGEYQRTRRKRFKAERIMINGYLVYPSVGHGSLNFYTSRCCRGPMCRASQRWYINTGEGVLPIAKKADQTAQDCATYEEWGTYK